MVHHENKGPISKFLSSDNFTAARMVLLLTGLVWAVATYQFGIKEEIADINHNLELIRRDGALTAQSINTIQLNHEKHIEDIILQLKDQNKTVEEHSRALVLLMERVGGTYKVVSPPNEQADGE